MRDASEEDRTTLAVIIVAQHQGPSHMNGPTGKVVCVEVVRDELLEESCKNTSAFAIRQCRQAGVFAFAPLEETVRLGLDVDVHMVHAAPERAATRSPLLDAVFGTG